MMKPYFETKLGSLFNGNCLDILPNIESESVNCCITSPPYYGLRCYNGGDAEIGLEQTPEEYVSKLVSVFREIKRILRDDGTLWLNLGDSYCSTAPGTMGDKLNQRGILSGVSDNRAEGSRKQRPETPNNCKPKDLMGIPWLVAFALRSDGWYLRQDIIWHKPNPMPESVTDRCTKAHEYIFLLSKSQRYFYDAEAIKEKSGDGKPGNRLARPNIDKNGGNQQKGVIPTNEYRNKRSVWTITTKPFSEAHFATFPEEIPTTCILAGCPKDGTVIDPFGGACTTAFVAEKYGRKWIATELNPDYCEISKNRIKKESQQLKLFA